MNFAQRIAEDRRLVILRVLAGISGYSANDSLLWSILPDFGHSVSRDQVITDLAWLAEQQLVSLEELAGVTTVATLAKRGRDAAEGRAIVPGVRRPSPD